MITSSVAPPSSSTALMICTQVVASMPPKSTYEIISAPTSTSAPSNGRLNISLKSVPAPTICAMR